MKKTKIGIADTTFARMNMGEIAAKAVRQSGENVEIVRKTVPGVKDLPVACKKLIQEEGCAAVVACGWVGGQEIDKTCAHEASLGIIHAQLLTNKHVLGAFVFENETKNERQLAKLVEDRVGKHALNAVNLALHPERLVENAGKGLRQGSRHAGKLKG